MVILLAIHNFLAKSPETKSPGRYHRDALKRIIRYLKGTTSKTLRYTKEETGSMLGFSDADWGGDPDDDRKSTTGGAITLMQCECFAIFN